MNEFLDATLKLATPLLLAALGEMLAERGGVINIGIEGLMLTAAFFGFWAALGTGSTLVGIGAGVLAAMMVALLFGWLTVREAADQIVVGTGVNLLALGITGSLYRGLFGQTGNALTIQTLSPIPLGVLTRVPFLGPLFAGQNLLVYLGLVLVPVIAWFLNSTGAGLSLRAVGEEPKAADTAGVNVHAVRLWGVVAGGGLVGLGGAFLSLGHAHTFTEGMSAGNGFIALAIVIFGRWNPWGVLGASLLFGATKALQFLLQSQGYHLPYQLPLALQYLIPLVVLTGVKGRSRAPAALAQPYLNQ
jgi:simple sugar transport system permease protein